MTREQDLHKMIKEERERLKKSPIRLREEIRSMKEQDQAHAQHSRSNISAYQFQLKELRKRKK